MTMTKQKHSEEDPIMQCEFKQSFCSREITY